MLLLRFSPGKERQIKIRLQLFGLIAVCRVFEPFSFLELEVAIVSMETTSKLQPWEIQ